LAAERHQQFDQELEKDRLAAPFAHSRRTRLQSFAADVAALLRRPKSPPPPVPEKERNQMRSIRTHQGGAIK
jgi:hypothetical protein